MSQIPQTLFGLPTIWVAVGAVTLAVLIVGFYFMLSRPKISFEPPPQPPVSVSNGDSYTEVMEGLWTEDNIAANARGMPVGATRRYQMLNPEPLAQLNAIRKLGNRNFTSSSTSDGMITITRHR